MIYKQSYEKAFLCRWEKAWNWNERFLYSDDAGNARFFEIFLCPLTIFMCHSCMVLARPEGRGRIETGGGYFN